MKKKFPPPSHHPIPKRDKRQKREPEAGSRQGRKLQRKSEEEQSRKLQEMRAEASRLRLVPIDHSKRNSRSVMPCSTVPTFGGRYYLDYEFTCKDCGIRQIWTGRQQKWWHEVMGGEIEQIAIRCRDCRIKERARKTEARRVHLEGVEKKRAVRMGTEHLVKRKRKRPVV